jgi:hypothetical protein
MSKSPAQIIDDKGLAAMAERLRKNRETIRMWRWRNRLPREAWPEIAAAYPDLTLDALKASEKRAGRDHWTPVKAQVAA